MSIPVGSVANNILDLIGKTPLIKINKLNKNKNVEIFAKLESYNPSGSIKDRVALNMISDAIEKGILTKNKIILEPTSGNTGTGIAMIASLLGYQATLVMSEIVSKEKIQLIKSFGAKVILTKRSLAYDGPITTVKKLVKKNPNKYVFLDQYSNSKNYEAHFKTGNEIWKQMNEKVDYLIAGIGTSGTLIGVAKYLKLKNPNLKVIAVHANSEIDGLKNYKTTSIPDIYDSSIIDEIIDLEREEALKFLPEVIKNEGILAGISSAASLNVAIDLSQKIKAGKIVVIFPDGFEKYLSSNII